MNNYEIRADKGTKLLDQFVPGWADKVDLETLLITSIESCILGQVFSDWLNGTVELSRLSGVTLCGDDGRRNQEEYGFELTYEEYTAEDPYVYTGQGLEDAWIKRIEARKS